MSKLVMVGTRVDESWIEQIRAIASVAGQKESEVVKSVIAQYLGKNDPTAVKGAIADLQERVIDLERKLGRLAN